MPDLLLELFSEEIPARMQRQAAEDLKKLVTNALVERGLLYEGAAAFATPRRLALHVAGLPVRQPDTLEERKGPRVGAPEVAIAGFLKSAGLASIDQATIQKDPKKGEFYVAVIERAGAETIAVLAEILPAIVKSFPWPKSMRWGAASTRSDSLRWVRPLHSIVATFGPETEAVEVVPFSVDGIEAGATTRGHRFMAPSALPVRRFDDYVPALERAKVVLDPARRRDIILHDAKNLAMAQGLELVEDAGLLDEVAGLVEWPVTLMGSFDESFLSIPPEVIRATIRVNQKCFVLRNPSPRLRGEGGRRPDEGPGAASSPSPLPLTPTLSPQAGRGSDALTNRFILVSNIEASDHGATVVGGNERVIAARLSDAKFFYETDLKTRLEDRLPKLDQIVFHEKLGTQGERVKRIAALARELAPIVGADPSKAERAATLCKADLVTEMVGEFPELQGLMGRYYASAQGEDASVAAACEEHYKPQGPSDRIPTDPVSIAVALADKLDTLVGFWAIDEKPTGSKDPYALRRAALGVVRIVLENGLRVNLFKAFASLYGWLLLRESYRSDELADAIMGASRNDYKEELASWMRSHPIQAFYLKADTSFDKLFNILIEAISKRKMDDFEKSLEGEATVPFSELTQAYDDAQFDENLTFMEEYGKFADLAQTKEDLNRQIYRILTIQSASEFSGPNLCWVDTWAKDLGKLAEDNPLLAAINVKASDLLEFFIDRLKVYLRDRGARYDLIDAALGAAPDNRPEHEGEAAPTPNPSPQGGGEHAQQDDLLMITRKVEALDKFLQTDDGKNLLAGFRRAANILKIEEKKDGAGAYDRRHSPNLRIEPAEHKLAAAIALARDVTQERLEKEDFEGAMRALSRLRAPVDAFFEHVTVNAENADLRLNRLRMLADLRGVMLGVADFGKVSGDGGVA